MSLLEKIVNESLQDISKKDDWQSQLMVSMLDNPLIDNETIKGFYIKLDEQSNNEYDYFRENIQPLITHEESNIVSLIEYSFTEILNNVFDHSEAQRCLILIENNEDEISLAIIDTGVGIFDKLMNKFNMENREQALFELTKGKLTTDSNNHTGEGIFFTSKMNDKFKIFSSNLIFYSWIDSKNDIVLNSEEDLELTFTGTAVYMNINKSTTRTVDDIFKKFQNGDLEFKTTIISINLAKKYQNKNLFSRGQAKDILSRHEGFECLIIDFANIDYIGRSFADELFRVFRNKNQNITITYTNANEKISKLIESKLAE